MVQLGALEKEESLVQKDPLALQVQLENEDSLDHKDQGEIREILVTTEKEDRRVTEDLQAYKVFLDHLAQLENKGPQALLVQVDKEDLMGLLGHQERKGTLGNLDQWDLLVQEDLVGILDQRDHLEIQVHLAFLALLDHPLQLWMIFLVDHKIMTLVLLLLRSIRRMRLFP